MSTVEESDGRQIVQWFRQLRDSGELLQMMRDAFEQAIEKSRRKREDR